MPAVKERPPDSRVYVLLFKCSTGAAVPNIRPRFFQFQLIINQSNDYHPQRKGKCSD